MQKQVKIEELITFMIWGLGEYYLEPRGRNQAGESKQPKKTRGSQLRSRFKVIIISMISLQRKTRVTRGKPKIFCCKGHNSLQENHRQNTQPEKTKGIDQNQNPSCNMNPQGHEFISHRIFGDYSTSIRKGCECPFA